MDCGGAAVGIEVPQYKPFYTVPIKLFRYLKPGHWITHKKLLQVTMGYFLSHDCRLQSNAKLLIHELIHHVCL